MSEVSIRLAVAGDVDAILALDRTIDNLPHWPVAEYRAAVGEAGAQALRCLFVGEFDGRIVGLAGGVVHSIADECWAEIETVGVAHGMQRRGLGRKLCRAVIGWCRSQGAGHIDLEVRSRGVGPIALYRQLGFEIAGKRPGYYRAPADDALLMRLDLKGGAARPGPSVERAT